MDEQQSRETSDELISIPSGQGIWPARSVLQNEKNRRLMALWCSRLGLLYAKRPALPSPPRTRKPRRFAYQDAAKRVPT